MQRIKELFTGEDRAVSPVIGVILMVAITVILAAVIASFVLGLGDSAAEPSPSPTINSDYSAQELEFSVTGGDDFAISDAEVQAEITVENSTGDTATVEPTHDIDADGATENITISGNSDNVSVYRSDIGDDEEVTAGDSFTFTIEDGNDNVQEDLEIVEWEVEIIWNPADQSSDTIYSDSS